MRMPKPPSSKTFNDFQQISHNCLKPKHQKTGDFGRAPESALGAGAFGVHLYQAALLR
jgi:hypothetical protein